MDGLPWLPCHGVTMTSSYGNLITVTIAAGVDAFSWLQRAVGADARRIDGSKVSATKMRRPRSAKRPQIAHADGRAANKKKFFGGSSEVLLGRLAASPGIGFVCPGQSWISSYFQMVTGIM